MLNSCDLKIILCRLSAILMAMSLVSACSTILPKQQSAKLPINTAENTPASATLERVDKTLLKDYLFQGLQALDAQHLSEPFQNSAVDFFTRALDVDPDNQMAKDGLSRVADRYLTLAKEAAADGSFSVSNTYLSKARRFGGDAIPAQLEQKVYTKPRSPQKQTGKSQSKAKKMSNEFLLPVVDLDKRGERINLRLTEIAVKAMRADSRITIEARNDAEGRWIYQQMRSVLVDYRLRGNIVRGSIPKVTLIDLTN